MPHVIVKMYAGKSEQQKKAIAEGIAKVLMETTHCSEAAVSVAIEEYAAEDWTAAVYQPDIVAKPDTLYKKPGYDPR
jgi:4-oxalocrotonate tautomerase